MRNVLDYIISQLWSNLNSQKFKLIHIIF